MKIKHVQLEQHQKVVYKLTERSKVKLQRVVFPKKQEYVPFRLSRQERNLYAFYNAYCRFGRWNHLM